MLRRDAAGVALLVAILVVAAGGSMAAAAGARRSASAGDRLLAVSYVPEAILLTRDLETFESVTSTPDVRSAVANQQLGLQPVDAACTDASDSYFPIVVPVAGEAHAIPKPRLVSGRLPSPDEVDVAVLSEQHAQRLGVGVGDRVSYFAHQLDERTADVAGCGDTVVAEVEVVGVIRELFEIGGTESSQAFTYLTPGFLRAHPEVPNLSELFGYQGFVDIAPGADATSFLDGVAERAPVDESGEPMAFGFPLPFTNPVQPALDATAVGMWALAAVTSAVGVAALAIGLARQIAGVQDELRVLAAVGVERRTLAIAASVPAIAVLVVGLPLALLVAAGLSTVHLIGLARIVEPEPGFDLDPPVLAAGALLAVVVVALLTVRLSWRAAGAALRQGDARVVGRPGVADAVAARGGPPWVALGIGYAVGGSRSTNLPSRGAVLGVVVSASGLLAVLLFGVGVGRASSDPEVYGWGDWAGFVSAPEQSNEEVATAVRRDPDVDAVAELEFRFKLRVGGELLSGVAVRNHTGSIWPTIVEGRPPTGAGEIALGRDVLRLLGLGVGDDVPVDGPDGQQAMAQIVGVFALPSYDGDGISGAWLAHRALLDAVGWPPGCNEESECFEPLTIGLRDGADREAVLARLTQAGMEVERPVPGPEVVLLDEVDRIPAVAATVVAILASIGVAHTLDATRRRRRRDLSVVRALGFVRAQLRGVFYAEGLTLGILGALVGGLLGAVVGRLSWRQAARAIGIGPDLPPTAGLVAAVLLGVVLLVTLLSVVPAHLAARAAPAEGLRDER